MLFLGYMVGNWKFAVQEHRVTALRNFCRRPDRKKELRSFLGGIGYHQQS